MAEIVDYGSLRNGVNGEGLPNSNQYKVDDSFGYLRAIVTEAEPPSQPRSFSQGRVNAHEMGHLGGLSNHERNTIMDKYVASGTPQPTYKQRRRIFRNRKKIKR